MIHHLPAVSRRTLLGAAAAVPTSAVLAGCTGGSAAVRSGVDQVTLMTSFGLLGRDAYPFVAAEQGFFDDSDLAVEVQPGNGTQGNLQKLLGGQAQFALIDLSGAMIARGQRAPARPEPGPAEDPPAAVAEWRQREGRVVEDCKRKLYGTPGPAPIDVDGPPEHDPGS